MFLSTVAVIVQGCAGTGGVAGAGSPRHPLPTPSPPGWFAFCAAHGGTADGACDPVPPAGAMRDGRAAAPPVAWVAYCRRHREDDACAL